MVKSQNYINQLLKKGYFIYNIKEKKLLNNLRNLIYINSKKILKNNYEKNILFNHFHKINNQKISLNEFRMKLMKKINSKHYASDLGFKIFSEVVSSIFGQDIVTQKNINLVIQAPNDETQFSVHRDAPPNSAYELVVWLPLTNVYKSKNMYILDKNKTTKLIKTVKNLTSKKIKKEKIMDNYYSYAFKNADKNKLRFGQALLFWTPLIHCVPENKENETRWSLNFRFKNTFTPFGTKGFPDYFKIANLSPVTKLVLEKEEAKYI